MIKFTKAAGPFPPALASRQEFDYQSPPRVGLNWPFAQAVTLSTIVWSSVAVSVVFWGCLLASALL